MLDRVAALSQAQDLLLKWQASFGSAWRQRKQRTNYFDKAAVLVYMPLILTSKDEDKQKTSNPTTPRSQ